MTDRIRESNALLALLILLTLPLFLLAGLALAVPERWLVVGGVVALFALPFGLALLADWRLERLHRQQLRREAKRINPTTPLFAPPNAPFAPGDQRWRAVDGTPIDIIDD